MNNWTQNYIIKAISVSPTKYIMKQKYKKIFILSPELQSTLVISKSKGLAEILWDIRTSTYQICKIEKKNKSNNHISKMNM